LREDVTKEGIKAHAVTVPEVYPF